MLLDKAYLFFYYQPVDNPESSSQSQPTQSGAPKILGVVILLIALILAGVVGYEFLGKKNKEQKPASTATTAQALPSPTSVRSIVSSIKEALAGSQSLKCDFTDESGRKIVSYIKTGEIRTDITTTDPKQSGSVIMKDKKVYFWNGKSGTMMAFDIDAMMTKVTPSPSPSETSPNPAVKQNPGDVVAAMEKYKDSCKKAEVSDALFISPSDVKFTDVSSMTKGAKAVPSGVVTGAVTQE